MVRGCMPYLDSNSRFFNIGRRRNPDLKQNLYTLCEIRLGKYVPHLQHVLFVSYYKNSYFVEKPIDYWFLHVVVQ